MDKSPQAISVATRVEDIKLQPQKHLHRTRNELRDCCLVDDELDYQLVEAHAERGLVGCNGGENCDTIYGHCSCGAYHQDTDADNKLVFGFDV